MVADNRAPKSAIWDQRDVKVDVKLKEFESDSPQLEGEY
jgi:hypothetical protein